MKSFATILALFTAAAIAAPTTNAPRANSITFSLINDVSGASAASTITADGKSNSNPYLSPSPPLPLSLPSFFLLTSLTQKQQATPSASAPPS